MQGCAALTECPPNMISKGRIKDICRFAASSAAVGPNQHLQFSLKISILIDYISNAISRGFSQCSINRATHNRSKVRISPAFDPMGPRFTFPHQLGAYIGGGGLQHVRHIIKVVAARQGNYILPYWATA